MTMRPRKLQQQLLLGLLILPKSHGLQLQQKQLRSIHLTKILFDCNGGDDGGVSMNLLHVGSADE